MIKEIKINVPQVANIVVSGPCQCGKSIVVDRIEKMLKAEFGPVVISKDLGRERALAKYEELADWEKKMVADTIWVISETNQE